MSTYTVKGTLRAGRGEQSFEREVDASSEEHAQETVFSQLGSEHGVARSHIAVDTVEER